VTRRLAGGQEYPDACYALVAMARNIASCAPQPPPRIFLCLLADRCAGIRSGPLAVIDLIRGGADRFPGGGFLPAFDDTTRGQVRHFAGTARAVTLLGARLTRWLSIHVRRDAPDSADGRLGEAALLFAASLLGGDLAVDAAANWIGSTLCTAKGDARCDG
jgi:hypothetical protein